MILFIVLFLFFPFPSPFFISCTPHTLLPLQLILVVLALVFSVSLSGSSSWFIVIGAQRCLIAACLFFFCGGSSLHIQQPEFLLMLLYSNPLHSVLYCASLMVVMAMMTADYR